MCLRKLLVVLSRFSFCWPFVVPFLIKVVSLSLECCNFTVFLVSSLWTGNHSLTAYVIHVWMCCWLCVVVSLEKWTRNWRLSKTQAISFSELFQLRSFHLCALISVVSFGITSITSKSPFGRIDACQRMTELWGRGEDVAGHVRHTAGYQVNFCFKQTCSRAACYTVTYVKQVWYNSMKSTAILLPHHAARWVGQSFAGFVLSMTASPLCVHRVSHVT